MKTHCQPIVSVASRLRVAAGVALLTAAAAQAAPTSVPNDPLETGGVAVPPNVLLVLDDSSSMQDASMPADTPSGGLRDDVSGTGRGYVNNTLYYNPNVDYLPWRTAVADATANGARLADADYTRVSSSAVNLTGSRNLADSVESYFYVPKAGIANPGADKKNYDKYRISKGGVVQKLTQEKKGGSWVDVWVDGTPPRLGKDKDGKTLLPRENAAERQNFANWYHYHRTRMKLAKAGASEAFGQLGGNYRIGYTSINYGVTPKFPIPTSNNDGLFEGDNRQGFYDELQKEAAPGYTPLRVALDRAGKYFMTDQPYMDSSGKLENMLTCRQNYTILTTDGYWNDNVYSPKFDGSHIGNADGPGSGAPYPDGISNTLADVAYHYWKTDLRPGMADNVRPSAEDTARYQHMVTFGVSIGLKGNLDPNNPPPNPWSQDPTRNNAAKIDDLWHAALNSRGSFVVAADTEAFAKALSEALRSIDERTASGSNIASSSTKTEATTLTFSAGFTSGRWLGDMQASPFNAAGTGLAAPIWKLSETFQAGGVNAPASFAKRPVLTRLGGSARLLSSITDTRFARSSGVSPVTVADNIAWLSGDQSKEEGKSDNAVLRKRAYPFGDIIHSSPTYVEASNTVYVGANDGMLHGIDARTGKVLFSYVPQGVDVEALSSLSAKDYSHRYFVDGQSDSFTFPSNGSNKTSILIGSLGRGGRGVFALNVSTPDNMKTGNLLWDSTTQDATSQPDMGYVLGAVRIRKGNEGKTWALVPNGIDSPNGSSTLFAYELNGSGGIIGTHVLTADAGGNNGLMSLGLADLDGNGTLDVVYGADMQGNVWRWDFGGSTPGAAVKLFQAVDAGDTPQPITGGLAVGRNPTTGEIVLGFGTGRFIYNADVPGPNVDSQTQSLYGIIDSGSRITDRSSLQKRTIPYSGKTEKGQDTRGFENYAPLPADKKGWYIDLPTPERVISAPTIYGTAMILTSITPAAGSDCGDAMGSHFLNALNLYTGTSPRLPANGYWGHGTRLPGAKEGEEGVVGSIGGDGLGTEANVTEGLVTRGDGMGLGAPSEDMPPPAGSGASRMSWRELIR